MPRRVIAALLVVSLTAACGGSGDDDASSRAEQPDPGGAVQDPGPVHVHGLGINPKDGALFIATHTGLFRAAEGERTARRVADRHQDTMGFTIVGPDHFLGSGHPDLREGLPPFLGLIRSTDAGKTWREVSLMGKSDFHVLEASGKRVYGFGSNYDTRAPEFLVSDDNGESWEKRSPPGPLLSLAVSPDDPDGIVAATDDGIYASEAAGRRWRSLDDRAGLLAWPRSGSLFLVASDGGVMTSTDDGRSWTQVGNLGGQPAAFETVGNDLYAALHDGTIKRSTNGGKRWTVRSTPQTSGEF
jgi:hypothetical protein